jgi:hypothetical protein
VRKWLALGLVVVGVLGFFTVRKRRVRRAPWRRLLAVYMVSMLGSWWNPASWFSAAGHIASSAVKDIENWAKNAINEAIDLYDEGTQIFVNAVDDAFSFLDSVVTVLGGWATDAYNWVMNAESWADNKLNAFFTSIWDNNIWPAISDARNWATDLYNDADSVISAINGTISSMWNDWLAPAVEWIGNAESWVANHINAALTDLYNDTIGPLVTVAEDAYHDAVSAYDWITGTAVSVVDAVIKAIGWIVWFGEHPIQTTEDIEQWVSSAVTGSWVRSYVSDLTGDADEIENAFAKLLGGL